MTDITAEQVAELLEPDPPKDVTLMALAFYKEGTPKHFFERALNLGEKRIDWIQQFIPAPSIIKECLICNDNFSVEDMYTLDCQYSHRYCFPCLTYYVKHRLLGSSVPVCPQCPSYEMTVTEVQQIVDAQQAQMVDEILTYRELQKSEYSACPTRDCPQYVALRVPGQKERCLCATCSACYCSLCKKEYHYWGNCNEAVQVKSDWSNWMVIGREEFLRKNMQLHKEALQRFEQSKKDVEKRNEELRHAYEMEKADEEYKAAHCKLCPHCGRVVETTGGCTLHVCGRDYHGGNVQQGCGGVFRWNEAQPYKSNIGAGPRTETLQVKSPVELDGVGLKKLYCDFQTQVDHGYFMCDGCKKGIMGLRFSCVNCPCHNFCIDCEARESLSHSSSHFFRIVSEKEDL